MSRYLLDDRIDPSELAPDLLAADPSLDGRRAGSLEQELRVPSAELERLFFARYGIEYVARYFRANTRAELRVVTHPDKTNTCFEKAEMLGAWDPLDVIKCLYLERADTGALYAVVVPETGCFVDRARVAAALGLEAGALRKATRLPRHMEAGTCSPFITKDDVRAGGGLVDMILFDTETLAAKKQEGTLDDFSFGVDHRMSVQMSYYHCYRMLKGLYPEVIGDEEILTLSFKELLVRTRGRLKISYEFSSLSYRIARFINSIHGRGDVSIVNDYVDELDLPDVLTMMKPEP